MNKSAVYTKMTSFERSIAKETSDNKGTGKRGLKVWRDMPTLFYLEFEDEQC